MSKVELFGCWSKTFNNCDAHVMVRELRYNGNKIVVVSALSIKFFFFKNLEI